MSRMWAPDDSGMTYPSSFSSNEASLHIPGSMPILPQTSGDDHSMMMLHHQQQQFNPAMAQSFAANAALQNWLVQYNQWWHYVQNQRREAMRQSLPPSERPRLTPHRYPHRHSRVSFGSMNQVIVTVGNTIYIQQIDPGLIDFGESVQVTTWPGPLTKGETSKDDVLEYMRLRDDALKQESSEQQLHHNYDPAKNHEKRQIWLLLAMLVKQNGILSGADISELLLSQNEHEFTASDDGTELAKLRRYLMLGQKKTALDYANKAGLWGHSFSLTFFNSKSPGPSGTLSLPSDMSMINMITKFMNTTLDREDPLSVLYRSLLAKYQQITNKTQSKQIVTDNLKQFSILLANDCDVSHVVTTSRSCQLLKLIVALRNHLTQEVVNSSLLDMEDQPGFDHRGIPLLKYTDEMVFINEILEFARTETEFIESLIPFKLRLTSRLFDFGHVTATTKYCYTIRQYHTYYSYFFPGKTIQDSKLDWNAIMKVVTDIECKLFGFDVTGGASRSEGNKEQVKSTEIEKDKSSAEVEEEDEEDAEDVSGSEDGSEIRAPSQRHRELPTVPEIPHRRNTQSSDISDIRSSSPLKGHLPTTRTFSNSSSNYNRLRSMSQESSTSGKKVDSPPPTPAGNPPSIPMMAPQRSASTFFIPNPSEETGVPNFLSEPPAANALHNQNSGADVPAPNEDVSGDSYGNNTDADFSRRLSAGPSLPFNSTAAPGFNQLNPSGPGFQNSPGFSSAFSPISSPNIQENTNRVNHENTNGQSSISRQNSPATQNGTSNGTNVTENDQSKGPANRSGWFGSIMAKVVPPGPVRAKLPDDSNPTIYYDEKLKRWIDKDNPDDGKLMDAIANGPPKMAPIGTGPSTLTRTPVGQSMPALNMSSSMSLPGTGGSSNEFSFVRRSNARPRYVDAWQQHQKPVN